ncbi:MAG: PhoX family phosphatase, partial [Paracoccaceae bacterium]
MTQPTTHDLTFDEFDEAINPRPEECDFDRIVEAAISRRGFLSGTLAFGSVTALGSTLAGTQAEAAGDRFAFSAISTSTADTVVVPDGYKAEVMVTWGDPLWSDAPEFDPATRGTAASQERAFGDNTDGQDVFLHNGHVLLVVNNEYTNRDILWGNNPDSKPASDDDIAKGMMAHGVSVVEIAITDGTWGIVKVSPYNRRITPQTDMALTGPAAGHDLMKTAADATGTTSKGTWNNCG